MSAIHRVFASGPDLVAERLRLGLRAYQVARHMGVTPQRVSELERLYRVPPRAVYRYIRALHELAGMDTG